MARKSFALKKNDPVVEQFRAGLMAWEHPGGKPAVGTTKAKTIRARGAIRTREMMTSGETDISQLVVPANQLVVEKFRNGLARWERRFKTGSEQG